MLFWRSGSRIGRAIPTTFSRRGGMVNTISVTRRIKYSMMKHWLLAARPKTLLAALSPVAIGTQMALVDGAFSLSALLATLLCAISIQVGTNFCNDYCDFRQGADTKSRKGPARAVQSGFISPRAMLIATIIAFAITGGSAWLLYLRAGWPFLLLGALSIILGIAYTAALDEESKLGPMAGRIPSPRSSSPYGSSLSPLAKV